MLRDDLRRIRREPALLVIEVAWRWTFGAAAIALLAFAFVRFQHAVAISGEEEAMLTSMTPEAAMEALGAIGARALPIATRLAEMIVPALVVFWVVAASMSRAAILSRLLSPNIRLSWSGFVGVHALRALSVVGLGGAYILASIISSWFTNPEQPNYLLTMAVFFVLFAIAVLAWLWVHWVLSVAAIYPVRDGLTARESVRSALGLVRNRRRELFAVASANGTARMVVGVVFTVIGLLPLPLYLVAPGLLIGLEVAIALVYCVVLDFLLLGRLAGYVEVSGRDPR